MADSTIDLNLVVYSNVEEIQADKASLEADDYTAKLENTAYALLKVIDALKDHLINIEIYDGLYIPVTVGSAALAEAARVEETLALSSVKADNYVTTIQDLTESAVSYDPGSTAAAAVQALVITAQNLQQNLEASISNLQDGSSETIQENDNGFIISVPADISKIKEAALTYIDTPAKSLAQRNDPLEAAVVDLKTKLREQVTDVLSELDAKVTAAEAFAAAAAAEYDNWDTVGTLFGFEVVSDDDGDGDGDDGGSSPSTLENIDNWDVLQKKFSLSAIVISDTAEGEETEEEETVVA